MRKTALITGASSGIGQELAYIHAQKGGDLVIVARSEDKLQHLKEKLEQQHSISVKVIVKDLAQANAAQEVYDEVVNSGILVDYLVNNAGFGQVGKFYELPWDRQGAMIQLNIVALTQLTHLFLPNFTQRNSGKILNVSSTASLLPGPLQAVYFATKAYVTSLSNALAEELSNTNVTVTNLMPGATETDFGSTSGMDKTALFANAASAKTVAQEGYQGMLDGKLDVMSGLNTSQKIMMSLVPLTPKKILLKQVHQMQEVQ
ncbi:SDR family NAD(P)-dependent oxidoreductase [Tunicatimonas pelagia]|uniref:SDR family NAD(P)-dependent oxidoreductase n=1 Tax=Tunicatimonas pelagia TaxID=931531 RepID=UPI002665FBBB|nr:SDR family oxidoreductase [Tunicatimonas pelagia]WKN42668.1 SDR family oxidoreductase [Tunicatimonas pelagia]